MQHNQSNTLYGLRRDPSNMAGGWPPIANMPSARQNQVWNVYLLSWQALVDMYEHQKEGMTLVIKAQEFSFHHRQYPLNSY